MILPAAMAAAKTWAGAIKRDVLAVYLAARDPRTPWPVRLLAMAVAAYALSPIDLIPDFIPVLGYLDDLLIVPLGLLLVVRLISPELLAEHRAAAARRSARPVSVAAAAVMIALWLAAGAFLWRWLEPLVEGWLF